MPIKAEIITSRATVRAIDKCLKVRGITAQKFALEIGVSEPSMVAWRKEGTPISRKSWEKLLPHIRPYLPDNFLTASGECLPNSDSIAVIPTLLASDLPKIRPLFQTVSTYARENNRKFRNILLESPNMETIFHDRGLFLAECPANSFGIPAGCELLCDCSMPPANGRTVLCVQGGKVSIGRFATPATLKSADGSSASAIDAPTLLATILSYTVRL